MMIINNKIIIYIKRNNTQSTLSPILVSEIKSQGRLINEILVRNQIMMIELHRSTIIRFLKH